MNTSKQLGELLPERIKTGTFLVIGTGDNYVTAHCKGTELLDVMEEFEFGAVGEASNEDRQRSFEHLSDLDNWWLDPCGYGPVQYSVGFGDIGRFKIFRIVDR